MQLQAPFNAAQFDPTQGGSFNQLPIGKHPVKIVASEIKPTSDNTGGMVVFELEVIDGPGAGARGPFRLNLYNQSDKARSIAESQLSALCHATGVFMLTDTAQLHNIPFAVDVEAQVLTPQQLQAQNEGKTVTPFTQVRKILDINGNEPKGAGGGAAPAPAPAAQAPAQAPAAAPAAAWGGGAAATPAQAPAAAPAAAWAQSSAAPAAAGAKPAWGR